MRTIETIEDFQDFIEEYTSEIISLITCEVTWDKKVDAINNIINENDIEIADDVFEDERYEEIILNIKR